MSDVYERLRERLDDFASGYPTTESEIEIKILKGRKQTIPATKIQG